MTTITVSATHARNKFFELLDQVSLGEMQIIIKKDRKEIAVISPKRPKLDWKGFLKASRAVKGILKDYDPNDNPLRRPGATNFLGRWDRGLKTNKKS